MKQIIPVLFPILLAACGGNSSGPSFGELAERGDALLASLASEDLTAPMPTNGTATYNGVGVYSTVFTDPVDVILAPDSLSEVQMTANFTNSSIFGRAFNFVSPDPALTFSGELAITNGIISGSTFVADFDGALTERFDGSSITGDYDGTLDGEFYGADAKGVVALGAGTIFPRAPFEDLGPVPLTAVIVAEQ